MAFGTLSVLDTLAASNQSVADYGEEQAFSQIEAALAAHNAQYNMMAASLMETSEDRLRRAGTAGSMTMQELDEYGAADVQKITAGQNVGFPLRIYGTAIQWTRSFFLVARASEIAAQTTAVIEADVRNLQRLIKQALMIPTNQTFVDRLVDNVELPVKRLVNADSADVPLGPNGESFDGSTHTHYLARAGGSMVAADVSGVISTVAEHYGAGQTLLYINRAQEAAIRGFTSNFTPYIDARIVPGSGVTVGREALDTSNLYNRPIGIFDNAEVHVKPWVPANYLIAWQDGVPKPLVRRVQPGAGGDLTLVYEDERHPLRARAWERRTGIGVWNRTGAACLYIGDTTYAAPSL